jgi:hypothetical protein
LAAFIWRIKDSTLRLLFFFATRALSTLPLLTRDIVLITASNNTHEKSLVNLLESIKQHMPIARVVVYDMGMTLDGLKRIEQIGRDMKLETMNLNFHALPPWMNVMTKNRGAYAWKPTIIFREVKRQIASNSMPRIVIWLDAGDVLVKRPKALIHLTLINEFFTTASRGKIHEWTVISTRRQLDPENRFESKRNLNAAILAFKLTSRRAQYLLSQWYLSAQEQSIIAPHDSNLDNHRFDQSLISLIAYKHNQVPFWVSLGIKPDSFGVLCHQDVDEN